MRSHGNKSLFDASNRRHRRLFVLAMLMLGLAAFVTALRLQAQRSPHTLFVTLADVSAKPQDFLGDTPLESKVQIQLLSQTSAVTQVPPEELREFTTLHVWRGRVVRFFEVRDSDKLLMAPMIAYQELCVRDEQTLDNVYKPPELFFSDGDQVHIRYYLYRDPMTGAYELKLVTILNAGW